MSLIVLLACLLAERFLLDYQHYRGAGWFYRYFDWFDRQQLPGWLREGLSGVIILLAPPLLGIALLQGLFDNSLFGIPGALFAGLVLLLSFGPQDLDDQISRYTEAKERVDEQEARTIAEAVLGEVPPEKDTECALALSDTVFHQANQRIFAVIFWFILLGPLGAVFYRLATYLPKSPKAVHDVAFFHDGCQLIALLDWLPSRLTAAAYAVAGSFEDALEGWRDYQRTRHEEIDDGPDSFLIRVGRGAMRWEDEDQMEANGPAFYLPRAAMGLVWRSLFVWLILAGLVFVAGGF